jgi:hypothetical protein
MAHAQDIVRVLRIIEYTGPRDWVERTVANSVHGTKDMGHGKISGATIGSYPEILHMAAPKGDE